MAVAALIGCCPTAHLAASPILAATDAEIVNLLPDAPIAPALPVALAGADATANVDDAAISRRRPLQIKPPMPDEEPPDIVPDTVERRINRPVEAPPDSLGDVLRLLVTRRPPAPGDEPNAPRIFRGDDDYFSPIKLALDSETMGEAVNKVVEIKATDGQFTIFSVLGMGDFVLEVEGNAQSAVFYEQSSGWAMNLVGGRGGSALLGYSADTMRSDGYGSSMRSNGNFLQAAWRWIIDAVTSPLGVFVTMMITIVLFMWIIYRVISRLQRRALGARR